MSCWCTHIDDYNPCICGALSVTSSTTTTTTTVCIGEPCEEAIDPRCIIYNGPNLPCYGIKTGDSAADIMDIILEAFYCTSPTTTSTTTTSTTTSTTSTTTSTTSTTTTASEYGIQIRMGMQAASTDLINIVYSTDGGTSWSTLASSISVPVNPSRSTNTLTLPVGTNVALAVVPASSPISDISYGYGISGTDYISMCGISVFYEILGLSSNEDVYFNIAISGGSVVTCP